MMKICPNCKESIPDDDEFCPYCLYKFEVPKAPPVRDPVPQPAPEPIEIPEPAPPVKKAFPKKLLVIIIIVVIISAVAKCGGGSRSTSSEENDISSAGGGGEISDNGGTDDNGAEDSDAQDSSGETEGNGESAAANGTEEPEEKGEEAEAEADPGQEEYVIPDSDSRYLTEADLKGLSASELRLARNEIYARHHRLFDDEGLQNYFNGCSWYEGKVSPSDFTEAYALSVFNEYELHNKDFILTYENDHK